MGPYHGHSRAGSKRHGLGLQHRHLVTIQPLPSTRPPAASSEPSLQALSNQLVEPESCTHTGPSEKGASTPAHLVSGVVSGLFFLSKRGFLQKAENALRKEEWARDPRNIKHLPLSPETHPLPKLFTERLQKHYSMLSDFLPEKSIIQYTPKPCTIAPNSSPEALQCMPLPQLPLASSAQSDHSILSPKSPDQVLCQGLPSHTPSQTQEEFISLLLSPTAQYFYLKKKTKQSLIIKAKQSTGIILNKYKLSHWFSFMHLKLFLRHAIKY